MKILTHNNTTWIDLSSPTKEDIAYVRKNFRIHPIALEEFLTPTIRARATHYGKTLFFTIHVPLFDQKNRRTFPAEIDVILTSNRLITGHHASIIEVTALFEKLRRSPKKREDIMTTPANLLYILINEVLEACFPRLNHVIQNVDNVEHQISQGKEQEMVQEISVVKRDILNFRRILSPQQSVLESIAATDTTLIPVDLRPYYSDLVGTNRRIWNTIESAKETIESLEDTNNSLLSNKINKKMRIMTFFSVLFIPASLYANIISMHESSPFAKSPYGFYIHLSIITTIAIITFVIFRIKKWV